MHPILIEIWKLKIYSYGFMLALSFFFGILLAGLRAEKRQVSPGLIYDLSIIIVISAIIGSRGLYILTHLDHYQGVLDIVALWQGGATYYGGLVLAVISSGIYLRAKKASFLQVADIIAPSIGLGIMLTRIGCFLSGCCFGEPTSCAVGMVFPGEAPAGYIFPGVHIHPTQLYSSLYGLIIFAVLILIDRKKRQPPGFLFGVLCVLYAVARFLVDFVRYYEDSAIVAGGLTDNQLISIGLLLLGIFLIWFSRARAEKA
ncbi:MAG: prolipoprotein diacylglyceryl transferase [Candidatus Krumholzibacteriales bacterium]